MINELIWKLVEQIQSQKLAKSSLKPHFIEEEV